MQYRDFYTWNATLKQEISIISMHKSDSSPLQLSENKVCHSIELQNITQLVNNKSRNIDIEIACGFDGVGIKASRKGGIFINSYNKSD